MFQALQELIDYKCMIGSMVKREIRGRYKGSLLGFLWNFLTPIVQILVYILVFTHVFRPSLENYAIYLTCSMILWIFFSESLMESSHVLVSNSDMLKKIYFPRAVLPIASVLSKMVNFLIMLGIFFVIALVTGYGVCIPALLTLLVFIPIFLLFLLGFSLLLSAIDVYLRDVEYMTTVIMMVLIWLTPVMYAKDQFDSSLLNTLIAINPMTYFVEVIQDILYWKCVPSLTLMLTCLGIAVLLFVVGALVFRHLEQDFAEVM